MNIRKYTILAFLGLVLSVTASAQDPVKNQVDKFTRLLRLVDSFYADSTDIEKLTEVAISKLLSDLDPHSVYISKDEVEEMNEPLQGSFEGIGISFNIFNDTLMVGQTIPGGPSEKVGLQAGDRILMVNKDNVAGVGLTNQQVFKLLRGDKGTLVTLSIFRKGHNELLVFDIIRDKIPIYSLDAAYMLDKETAYIKLNRFSATTTDEFVDALKKMKSTNPVKNVVLDLRGNGGGFLKQAHEISDHFLPNGAMVVYTEGLKNPKKTYKATTMGDFETGKVVVLIDGGSASASEIVAGAIQDWDRGIIIGRRSFGKGLVQQPYNLTDGSMIRLTTAHYYTPSGRCIQKPYEGGVESYRNDMYHRAETGELFSKDSISYDSSMVFKTLINKRKVYGGGGVIPDIFVPIDTSVNYRYYNQLVQRSVVNQFVVSYMDKNRSNLTSTYPTFENYKSKFEVSDAMLEEIWAEGEKKEIARSNESIEFIRDHAKRHIKAIMARDLFGTGYFYEIINSNDDEIQEAVKVLKDEKKYNRILKGLE
jgi:carboxyl-terminal processing protease